MGILTGKEISTAIRKSRIRLTPFEEENLNVNSYDLRLGKYVIEYDRNCILDTKTGKLDIMPGVRVPGSQNLGAQKEICPDSGMVLVPGKFYLMHTHESVYSNTFIPILDGKSSIARAGVKVHFTAGYGDVGFDGQFTLEVESAIHVRIYPYMRICQVRFHTSEGEPGDYKQKGNYVSNLAHGPVPSQVHKQIEKDRHIVERLKENG